MHSSITGLPLDIIMSILEENNMIVDWIDFYQEGLKHGWKVKTLLNRIETAIGDYYEPVHKKEVMKRINFFITKNQGEL